MTQPIETLEYNGHKISIFHDEDAQSPRKEENMCLLCLKHKRYNCPWELPEFDTADYASWEAFDAALEQAGYWFLPVFAYEHGGIVLSTTGFTDPWDSGRLGFIAVKKDPATPEERALEWMKQEVDIYSQYLSGEVYGYVIDEDGDSCWGFYETKYAIEAAKEEIGDGKLDTKEIRFRLMKLIEQSRANPDLTNKMLAGALGVLEAGSKTSDQTQVIKDMELLDEYGAGTRLGKEIAGTLAEKQVEIHVRVKCFVEEVPDADLLEHLASEAANAIFAVNDLVGSFSEATATVSEGWDE